MLDSLPVELLRAVLANVHNKSHFLALSRVSKKFRYLVFPQLFEVLTIKPYEEYCLWDFQPYPFLDAAMIARVPNVLAAVKELRFSAPFELTDLDEFERCPHSLPEYNTNYPRPKDDLYLSQEDDGAVIRKRKYPKYTEGLFDSEDGDSGLIKLATQIARLLSALPDNQLISFRWDMGTCFPKALLGAEGYLVTHQNCIRRLALITEGACFSGGPALMQFTNLRELSWKGLLSEDDCAALKAFLDLYHKRLASFEVDFIDWAQVESRFDLPEDDEDGDKSTLLTDLILPERRDEYNSFLPNLQILSLSAASFKGSWDRLIDAFNLRSVKELRLLNCRFAAEMLDYMARTNISLRATQVELSLVFDKIDFLAPFHSLVELFLMFDADYADQCFAEMILRHRATLRRLVYHRRHYCLSENSPYCEQLCDSSLEEKKGRGFAEILCKTKLESAGVCGEPSKLQESFQSIAPGLESLKLLHLRFTGKVERKPKFFKESDAYDGDSPSPEFNRARLEAQQNGTTPPRNPSVPSEAQRPIRWEQIQWENWREDEEKELEAFANWAFGTEGFPRLQVLASGDFSHGNRFVDTHTLWCRETGGSRRSNKTWRTVEQSDVAENELIDANMDLMSACPVSPLFYKYGREDEFPGIS